MSPAREAAETAASCRAFGLTSSGPKAATAEPPTRPRPPSSSATPVHATWNSACGAANKVCQKGVPLVLFCEDVSQIGMCQKPSIIGSQTSAAHPGLTDPGRAHMPHVPGGGYIDMKAPCAVKWATPTRMKTTPRRGHVLDQLLNQLLGRAFSRVIKKRLPATVPKPRPA